MATAFSHPPKPATVTVAPVNSSPYVYQALYFVAAGRADNAAFHRKTTLCFGGQGCRLLRYEDGAELGPRCLRGCIAHRAYIDVPMRLDWKREGYVPADRLSVEP